MFPLRGVTGPAVWAVLGAEPLGKSDGKPGDHLAERTFLNIPFALSGQSTNFAPPQLRKRFCNYGYLGSIWLESIRGVATVGVGAIGKLGATRSVSVYGWC